MRYEFDHAIGSILICTIIASILIAKNGSHSAYSFAQSLVLRVTLFDGKALDIDLLIIQTFFDHLLNITSKPRNIANSNMNLVAIDLAYDTRYLRVLQYDDHVTASGIYRALAYNLACGRLKEAIFHRSLLLQLPTLFD